MADDFGQMLDFMTDEDGFLSPPMPSTKHPEGKQYRIPSPDAKTGLRLNALADIMARREAGADVSERDIARLRMEKGDEREFVQQILGPALAEMTEDGCRWTHIKRMASFAFIKFGISDDAAELALKNGLLQGKAPTPPNRAAKRAKSKKRKTS